jgi:hypothetical protein
MGAGHLGVTLDLYFPYEKSPIHPQGKVKEGECEKKADPIHLKDHLKIKSMPKLLGLAPELCTSLLLELNISYVPLREVFLLK